MTESLFRRLPYLVLLLPLICLSTRAQSQTPSTSAGPSSAAAQGSEIRFSTRSELVLVPVLVNKGGDHVPGLKQEDFVVKQDGKQQRLAVFEEIKAAPGVRKPVQLPKGVYSNIRTETSASRLLIIAFDAGNTSRVDQPIARQQILEFLAKGVPTDTMLSLVVLGRGRMRVVHPFTSDPTLLIDAVTKLRGEQPSIATQDADAVSTEADTLQDFVSQSATEFLSGGGDAYSGYSQKIGILDTLSALQQLALAYSGVPGRKALIWISDGFPFSVENSSLTSARGIAMESLSDVLPEYEKTWRVINDANISIYPVDARGLVVTSTMPASVGTNSGAAKSGSQPGAMERQLQAHANRQRDRNLDRIATMSAFAEMTGGHAYYNTNDLNGSFRKAANDSAAYYLLGYYLNKDSKPGWHKLKVEVAHRAGEVRARSGFFSSPAGQDADNSKKEIAIAMASPLDFSSLPLYVSWKYSQVVDQSAKRKVGFLIGMPLGSITVDTADDNHMVMEFAGVARMKSSQETGDFIQTVEAHFKPKALSDVQKQGIMYNNEFDLLPGEYSVRFVARDNLSGRIGSITVPLVVK